MNIPSVSLTTAEQLGLLPDEYEKIINILGRTPNFTELSVYSVMWSEHCSYKNSILQLKTLPTKGDKVLAEAGEEGAGLMDLGDDLVIAFKIESHNHPSAIEPYQGAATGVGGIHRDIFSLGARPIASLNSLRFGNLGMAKTRHLLKGVVKGIGDYGNAFGVPTVSGELDFDPCYNTNPLVNAMSVGIAQRGTTVSATASGTGNPVFIVGSATGKDGIHGATFASEDISEESEEKLPSVQVGDPFAEKLLLEATLEAIASGTIVGVQDMGAAGITCATCEMSAKGEVGMDVWLDKVPMRQDDMQPFEILLSESQERMLLVVEQGKEQVIKDIFDKWDLYCEQIAVVTDTGLMRYHMHGEMVAEIPAETLVLGGGAPVYIRTQEKPEYTKDIEKFSTTQVPVPEHHEKIIRELLALPSIASKRWVLEQYDSMVGTGNTSTNQPSEAPVIRIHGTAKAIPLTTYCNSRYVYSDPYTGAAMAVAKAARSIVCAGGEPLGVTNCLNFGNPYNPAVYWQFAEAIRGMGDACSKFDTPITGGNVSFYNQSEQGPVYPTPTIGMVGLINDLPSQKMSMSFSESSSIYLLGKVSEDMGSSSYLYHYHQISHSPAPYLDLDAELNLQKAILELIGKKVIQSAHNISDGGLIISLLESAFAGNTGFEISVPSEVRSDAFLYGEAGGRVTVSIKSGMEEQLKNICSQFSIPVLHLGKTGGDAALINGENIGSIAELGLIYESVLHGHMQIAEPQS